MILTLKFYPLWQGLLLTTIMAARKYFKNRAVQLHSEMTVKRILANGGARMHLCFTLKMKSIFPHKA